MSKISKKRVVEAATQQSQNAQSVTRQLRVHAWGTRFTTVATENGPSLDRHATTDEERHEALRNAVESARRVARDAEAVLSWVEAYARQEGAIQ